MENSILDTAEAPSGSGTLQILPISLIPVPISDSELSYFIFHPSIKHTAIFT